MTLPVQLSLVGQLLKRADHGALPAENLPSSWRRKSSSPAGETWTPRTDHESPILLTPPPTLPSIDLGLPSPPGPSAQASSALPSFSFT